MLTLTEGNSLTTPMSTFNPLYSTQVVSFLAMDMCLRKTLAVWYLGLGEGDYSGFWAPPSDLLISVAVFRICPGEAA